jgi:hypothetical protein
MLKSLNINDVLVTPYSAVKECRASNIANTDLILFEHTGSDGGPIAVAVEFIDYGDGSSDPTVNSSCSLANELQSLNLATYREGKKINGTFYPTEDQNRDNTYKRIVFNQTKEMFYNNHRDPTKMWGMEEIDFDKSQTKKFLQDKFLILNIPTEIMGEKILPNSVLIDDQTSDDKYTITDDGRCNLVIGTNVFSKHQELGEFVNFFTEGHTNLCDNYWVFNPPTGILNLTASQVGGLKTASLNWVYSETDVQGFYFERSEDSGSTWPYSFYVSDGSARQIYDTTVLYRHTYWYRTYAYNAYGSSNWSNTASVYINGIVILNGPNNVAGDISGSVSFSVIVNGLGTIYYQWESGSTILSDTDQITGSTTSGDLTSSLYINQLRLENSGSYRVYVWNSVDALTSSYADLHVNLYPPTVSVPVDVTVDLTGELPIIDIQPEDTGVFEGSSATFTVSASGQLPISYYWRSSSYWLTDNFNITGSQTDTLTITSASTIDSAFYSVLVSNDGGYVISNDAFLTVFTST